MTDRKLVSIITPTWQRPKLLVETIATVNEQTYRPLEYVIVVDGNDPDTLRAAQSDLMNRSVRADAARWVPTRTYSLGRNWSSLLPASFCAAPLTVGMLMADGEYQMWLADDERMAADHVELLVDALESSGADFAYGRVRMYREGGVAYTIGADPPTLGQITNVLYRADVLRHGLYAMGAGMTSDWVTIRRWLDGGARHVFVDRVSLTHRIDH